MQNIGKNGSIYYTGGETNEMTFRELLKEKDFSAAQVGRRIGKSRTLVGYWVLGRNEPNLSDVVKLSKILNVSIEQVVMCFVLQKRKLICSSEE